MIFAAGMGTRMKPLTDTLPKALVCVGGKPLLYHAVKKLKEAGVTSLVINVHHFADSIIRYVHEQDDFGMEVRFSDERDCLLETGGGILHAKQFLEGDSFIVHNVDILSDLDIVWFAANVKSEDLATVLVSERETQRYLLFDDEMKMVGWTHVATGEVRSPYGNLDPRQFHRYAFDGIHFMPDCLFNAFESGGWEGRFPIMDFYIEECKKHTIRGLIPPNGVRMIDVGKPDALARAEEFIKSNR